MTSLESVSSDPNPTRITDIYSTVELTKEEFDAAILEGRKKKFFHLRALRYREDPDNKANLTKQIKDEEIWDEEIKTSKFEKKSSRPPGSGGTGKSS